jgi:hypothetical protein
MKSNNNNNDDDDDDDDNRAVGSVHAWGDTFLTFGLKALTETNTSRLATDVNNFSCWQSPCRFELHFGLSKLHHLSEASESYMVHICIVCLCVHPITFESVVRFSLNSAGRSCH